MASATEIIIGGKDASETILGPGPCGCLGAAWVYDKYVVDLTLYDLQTEARVAERGIWSLPESQQIPPWLWRRR